MSDAPGQPILVPVRVDLDPATALRCVAALQEGRSSEHLRMLFDGTRWASAILTLCASLDKARFQNRDQKVRLQLRLAEDEGTDFDVRLTFPAVPARANDGHTTPPAKITPTGQGPGSSGGSSASGSASSSGGFMPRAPATI